MNNMNPSEYDSSYSPNEAGEASDIPNCSMCADTGVIDEGACVASTIFCEWCDMGEETMVAWADGEADAQFDCHEYDDYDACVAGGDYWTNDAGEWCCG